GHRNRTGAGVAAVTAAVAGSVTLSLFLASQDDLRIHQATQIRLGQAWIVGNQTEIGQLTESDLAPVAQTLPVRDTVPLRYATGDTRDGHSGAVMVTPVDPDQEAMTVAIGDASTVRAIVGHAVPAEVSRTLEDGGAVVMQPDVPVHDGRVTLSVFGKEALPYPDLPAVTLPAPGEYGSLPAVVIGEPAAARLGMHPEIYAFLFDTTRTPTPAEGQAAAKAFDDLIDERGLTATAGFSVQRPFPSDLAATLLVLVGISGLVTLMATGIAVGLTVAESRDDLSTLAAVGAAPRVRRVLSMGQAGLIAGLGTVLGFAAGILPAAGVVGVRDDLRWVVPWRYLVIFAIVPVLAMLLSGAVTRSRLTLARRLS
ncbi:MAG TPA: FtsX-like permease family protein, partial [Mycobacteriales bacterium]